jgi:hypothetical protein
MQVLHAVGLREGLQPGLVLGAVLPDPFHELVIGSRDHRRERFAATNLLDAHARLPERVVRQPNR